MRRSGTGILSKDQALYHGLSKPREAHHDADLYRLGSGRVPWSRALAVADTDECLGGDCIGKSPSPGADSIFHTSESNDGLASAGISPSSAYCSETSSG